MTKSVHVSRAVHIYLVAGCRLNAERSVKRNIMFANAYSRKNKFDGRTDGAVIPIRN